MNTASIISIGNEILSGQTVDTNQQYLSEKLLSVGISTVACYTVGDEIDLIVEAITQAANHADIILITGGLGPTDDDITRNALAQYLGVELEFQPELYEQVKSFFAGRNYQMPEKNRVQAFIPAGAQAMQNHRGTAPGIMAKNDGKIFAAMPGVPIEMKKMFDDTVMPALRSDNSGKVVVVKRLRCFGIGESALAEMLGDMMKRGQNPLVNCTVSGSLITLHIVATAENAAQAEEMIEKQAKKLKTILGPLIYGTDQMTLAQSVGEILSTRGQTVATAESCTGGMIAKLLTDTPGSSQYFTQGWVTYCNEAKIDQLGVEKAIIDQYGAVSEQVALQMAAGARQRSGSDYAIAVTGIAGPTGGTEQKPVGLVYIAIEGPDLRRVEKFIFSHGRTGMRKRTAFTALNMLRLELQV